MRQAWAPVEAFSKALPWSEGLGFFLFPTVFSPQFPLCQEPSRPPVLCRAALPKEHGGSPGLAALPALLPRGLAALGGPSKALTHRGSFPGQSLGFRALVAAAAPQPCYLSCLPHPGLEHLCRLL